jgi:hypothetical protein
MTMYIVLFLFISHQQQIKSSIIYCMAIEEAGIPVFI